VVIKILLVYTIGDIKIEVSQPRQACWKVGALYGKDVSRYILKNFATGWYVRVLVDGTLYQEDEMILEKRVSEFSIKDLNEYLFTPPQDKELIQKILNTPALANAYKKDLQRAIDKKISN
jgi:MOSC domain-containing protein YiiM